jgi:hypothetical protein
MPNPIFAVAANRFAAFAGFTIDLYEVIAVSPVTREDHPGIHRRRDVFKVYTESTFHWIEADDGKSVRNQFISAWRAASAQQVERSKDEEFFRTSGVVPMNTYQVTKDLPKLGGQIAGGTFAGIIAKPDGNLTWEAAKAWAAAQGGELPSRSVIDDNHREGSKT